MSATLIKEEQKQLIQGPVGQLEIVTEEPLAHERKALGIVCHPHSLHGGSMQNKVVTTLAKAFQYLGLHTVRFNFRGVGKSEGAFDEGRGELLDLLAVIEWMKEAYGDCDIWLAGFSFGSYVVAKAATETNIKKLVTVAPPVQDFPMLELPPIYCSWILVQGELDDVVPPKAVFEWAENRDPKPLILRFPQAGHFFHGQLIDLRTRLEMALKS